MPRPEQFFAATKFSRQVIVICSARIDNPLFANGQDRLEIGFPFNSEVGWQPEHLQGMMDVQSRHV